MKRITSLSCTRSFACSFIALIVLICSACNEWFDVTPSSEIRKTQHYSSAKGFQQTLTGCYITMAGSDLYGKALTWHLPEVLAHQYLETSNPQDKALYDHNYKEEASVITLFDKTWEQMYNVISNVNDALDAIETRREELLPLEYGVIKGELLAIRAFLQFDLLRLYGYGDYARLASELDEKATLPYQLRLHKDMPPQYTGREYYDLLCKDLEEAASLLKEYDPMLHPQQDDWTTANVEGYYDERNLHLNYYAVKALEARVHLWFGTSDACQRAKEAALEVVMADEDGSLRKNQDIETTIHLLKPGEVSAGNLSFGTEALFCMDVPKLNDLTSIYLKPSHNWGDAYALAISGDRIKELFGEDEQDLRLTKALTQSPKTKYFVSIKYANPNQTNDRINIIRLPEVYFILAEASLKSGDKDRAIEILNKIRTLRSISTPLEKSLSAEEVMDKIYAEYEREFISEGVLFFTQKRLGKDKIVLQEGWGPSGEQPMTAEDYVIPFPVSEVGKGRIQ